MITEGRCISSTGRVCPEPVWVESLITPDIQLCGAWLMGLFNTDKRMRHRLAIRINEIEDFFMILFHFTIQHIDCCR